MTKTLAVKNILKGSVLYKGRYSLFEEIYFSDLEFPRLPRKSDRYPVLAMDVPTGSSGILFYSPDSDVSFVKVPYLDKILSYSFMLRFSENQIVATKYEDGDSLRRTNSWCDLSPMLSQLDLELWTGNPLGELIPLGNNMFLWVIDDSCTSKIIFFRNGKKLSELSYESCSDVLIGEQNILIQSTNNIDIYSLKPEKCASFKSSSLIDDFYRNGEKYIFASMNYSEASLERLNIGVLRSSSCLSVPLTEWCDQSEIELLRHTADYEVRIISVNFPSAIILVSYGKEGFFNFALLLLVDLKREVVVETFQITSPSLLLDSVLIGTQLFVRTGCKGIGSLDLAGFPGLI